MLKISTIMACVLALSAPAALAQNATQKATMSTQGNVPEAQVQQALAHASADKAKPTFIHDEYGNLYDGKGDPIRPRPVKLR